MKELKALPIPVLLVSLLLSCAEGRSVESMLDPSGSSQLNISAWPPEDEDDVVGFCSESGNKFALEMTCEAPVCAEYDLNSAVPPRLFFNDADIRKAAQVELGQSENFPSNCSKQWTMNISLLAGESAIVHCSQQRGRVTSKDIVLQSDAKWCKRLSPGQTDDHITAKVIPTTVMLSNSSTGDVGGGGNESTSIPDDSYSDAPSSSSWGPVVAICVVVVLLVVVLVVVILGVSCGVCCSCCKKRGAREIKRVSPRYIIHGKHGKAEQEDFLNLQQHRSECENGGKPQGFSLVKPVIDPTRRE